MSKQSSELKLCPFCASADVQIYSIDGGDYAPEVYEVACDTCWGTSGYGSTEEQAADLWNNRSTEGLEFNLYTSPPEKS